jgi:predicted RNA binding protein YcfA (HicA-like mRNA interferase family)
MTELAGFSGREIVRRLQKLGYTVLRQRGSHVRLVHADRTKRKITVPMHKEIGVGLLSQILNDAGVNAKIFLSL